MAEKPASQLCTACGLCCSGAIFAQAKAEPEERARIEANGLEYFESDSGPRFRLPCQRLEGTRCTIYEERFAVCRRFRCSVLQRFEAGELPREQAAGLIATARAMVARLDKSFAGLGRLAGRRAFRAAFAADPPAARREKGRLLLDAMALDRFLDRHFRTHREMGGDPGM